MIRIKINNIEFLVNSNLSVLEACQFVGVHIPRFCYHETLSIAGNCRMCLVEIEKSPKPVASCALPISNNISIFTDSPLVKKARENILESLLLNHPLDCPICDQGGECDLQDQTKLFGGDYSRYYISKRVVESKPFGSIIKTIMTRCIHCTRCVRFSEEIAGTSSFGTLNRGKNTEIGSYTSSLFDSEISGNVVDLCPVGALTFKPYAFKARPWELKYQESIDCSTSLCTPIIVNVKESDIVRIQPKADYELENLIISDKIRFLYDSVKKNRIQQVFKKNIKTNDFQPESWNSFYEIVLNLIKDKKNLTFLVDENIDLKSTQLLKSLENTNIKIINVSNYNYNNLYDNSTQDSVDIINKKIKTCFLISTNLKIETTLLNTKLRLKFNKTNLSTISSGSFYKSNYFTKFINLSTNNTIKLFEGKLFNSKNFINQVGVLLIIGNSLSRKIKEQSFLVNLYKTVCPSGFLINNQIHSNSVGLKFMGINGLQNNIIKSTDYFFCLNIEDNIKTRKILSNKFFFWFNTHGSNLASKAIFILPTLTFFESENSYINIDGLLKKTQKILPNLKDSKSCFDILKFLFNNKIKIELKSQDFLKNYTYKNNKLKFKSNFKNINKSTYIFFNPNKNILENFYGDCVMTKNSITLSKRAQELKKSTNYNFLTLY